MLASLSFDDQLQLKNAIKTATIETLVQVANAATDADLKVSGRLMHIKTQGELMVIRDEGKTAASDILKIDPVKFFSFHSMSVASTFVALKVRLLVLPLFF